MRAHHIFSFYRGACLIFSQSSLIPLSPHWVGAARIQSTQINKPLATLFCAFVFCIPSWSFPSKKKKKPRSKANQQTNNKQSQQLGVNKQVQQEPFGFLRRKTWVRTHMVPIVPFLYVLVSFNEKSSILVKMYPTHS